MFINAADRLIDFFAHIEHPGSNCGLNLPIANTGVITCKDGGLVSVIEIRGCRSFVGQEEHDANVESLTEVFTPYFLSKCHDIGFFYESDNDTQTIDRGLDKIFSPVKSASNALGLHNANLLKEDMAVLAKNVHIESCWLVCWTTKKVSSVVPLDERLHGPAVQKLRSTDYQDLNGITDHASRGSQHDAMLDRVLRAFKDCKFSVKKLSTAELVRNIRNCIDARKTGPNWEPLLVGNRQSNFIYPAANNRVKTEGAAAVMPPRLGYQVWPVEPETPKNKSDALQVGSRVYKVMALRIAPNGRVPFNKILKEAAELNIPLRFSGLLHSSGTSFLAAKYALASIMTLIPFPGRNKMVRDEIDQVKKLIDKNRTAASATQMCFATWAPVGEERQLDFNADKLLQIVNGWKQADAYFLKDDIFEGFVSTLPAYRNASVAPAAVGPLDDCLHLMPITRPTMPFDTGGMCFTSEDGRPMPFQPFDYSVMRHHIYLVVGEPGYGKSAFINNLHTALVSSSNDIPYVGIVDVGTSSLGAILLAQSILPEGKKHYAMYHRMRNREEDAYNFLETDYGLRAPLKEHFDEICNQLELMLSDDRNGGLHSDMPGLIRAVVKLAYRMKSDTGPKSDPEFYRRNKHNDQFWPEVAKALDRINLTPTEDHTWWSIFDELHDAEEFRAAYLVQRFAGPILPYLAMVAARPEIREEYPGDFDSGMPITDYFSRRIGELVDQYPVFATYTQLDLGEARIVSLDLEEVVPRATKQDYSLRKQGAIFFSLGARILTSRFFWKEERLKDIPERYHGYHREKIRSIRQTVNVFTADELQRFVGIPQTDALCEKIANEGRKWEIGIMLSSQDVTEMPDRLVKFSTARIVCGFEEKSVDGVVERFKLTPTERELIVKRIRPPSKEGATVLMQLDADEGMYSHLLTIRMGPEKLWGLSTRNKDAVVRSSVYDEFGDEKGREILAKMYPSGSIMEDYDIRVQRLSSTEDMGLLDLRDITDNKDVIGTITQNIISAGKELFAEQIRT